MVRAFEAQEPTPPQTRADGYASMSFRQVAPYFAFALLCYCAAPYLGLDSRDVDPRIAEVWPPGGVGFVLLTTIWFTGRRVVALTLAGMVAIFLVTALAMSFAPHVAVVLALVGVGQPLLMTWLYRRHLSHPGWAPESPQEVGALLYAAVSSSLLAGVLGGFPLLMPDDLPTKVLLWWVLRNTVFCFVGGVTFMVMFYGRRSKILPPSSWPNRIGLVATAAACVYGTYLDASLPLSWLLIVPSVWGGLTLTVRGTAYLAITVALLSAGMTYLPENQFGYGGVLPASSIIDLLIIASTAFLLLLTLMREQRGTLIDQLAREGKESEKQRQVLETVFNSMTDGVIIVDSSEVSMFNQAARQLLGRPIPTGTPVSWSQAFGLTDAEGGRLDDDALRAGLFTPDVGSHAKSLEVRVGQDNAPRILDVTAQPLGDVEQRSTIVLLHDVTAQRARLRELSNFAGMVAHDLRGPLTVLDGWLEVVQDEDEDEERSEDHELIVEDAVRKARDASKRMRQVIEDWLNYTVVQNGQLRPDAVKLEDVAIEIIASRRAHWAEADEPRFVLDLSHRVEADPGLLRQLLDNLVGNAIKYTPGDQAPWIELHSEQDTEPGWIRVEIIDRGIGIPEGQEELIFGEFHRGPVEGRSAGTGLGLALTRRIVALHGGQIRAWSNAEGGSTFSFTLPEA